VGSTGSGPWLLQRPQNAPPVLFDWRQDFPLRETRALVPAGPGHIAALDEQGHLAIVRSEPVRADYEGRITRFSTVTSLTRDRRGHLWGLLNDGDLEEWDGDKWIPHAAPGLLDTSLEEFRWVHDDANRGWSLSKSDEVGIIDFDTGQWKRFPHWEDALVAQLPRGVHLPATVGGGMAPAYSGDGKIAYLELDGTIHYYDGKEWTRIAVATLGLGQVVVENGPFFYEGRLMLAANDSTYERTPEGRWLERASLEIPKKPDLSPLPEPEPAELEKLIPGARSSVVDSLGVRWVATSEAQLYKMMPHQAVPALTPGEPNPFRYLRPESQLDTALTDAKGNAFLTMGAFEPLTWVILRRQGEPLRTEAKVTEVKGDEAFVGFSSIPAPPAGTKRWYRWSLDGAPWQPLQEETSLRLDALPSGRHRLKVSAVDEKLEVDPEGAEVTWDSAVGVAEMAVSILRDFAEAEADRREAAARAITGNGVAMLPALREARANADEEQRWWIDAVTQAIERERGASGRP
jgi:hypothetical protein